MESGTVVHFKQPVSVQYAVRQDVRRLITLTGLTDKQIAERLNRELGITLVSPGVVRLWAQGSARPPFEWIETLARFPHRAASRAESQAS